jgi:hypothetical protein
MNKNILLLSFASLLCGAQYTFAKDANPVQVKCFEANGALVYDVRGCVPGSDISFYSQQGGGDIMKELAVNASGSATVVWSQKASPAFVLNVLDVNSSGIAGNGMVSFTGDKEFTVNDVALDNNGGSITLRWNGSVTNPPSYTFEVLKSINGGDYTLVQSLNAQSASLLPYAFTDPSQSNGTTATYQVRVIDNGNNVYYTSNPLYADGINGISVYPTVVHSVINVSLNDKHSSAYKIINMNGQLISSGSLSNGRNACSVAALPVGSYMIEVATTTNKTTTKFVKE